MNPQTRVGWLSAALTLVVTAFVGALFFVAFSRAVYLVDFVPGADAGLATSAALAAARAQATALGALLLLMGAGTAAVLFANWRRLATSKSRRGANL